MRKPNITEGEWSYVYDNYCGLYADKEWFATVDINAEEDLKAISAVPEMIDALIKAHALIESMLPTNEVSANRREINLSIIEKALKKAGCTDD